MHTTTTLRAAAIAALWIASQAHAAAPVNPAGPPPATAGRAISANPALTVAHTRITSMQVSSTSLKVGDTLIVKMYGTGVETQCPTTVLIAYKGNNYYKVSHQVGTGAWPRVSSFVLTAPGQYLVRNLATESAMLSEAEKLACGFHYSYGTSGIPGDNAVIEVADIAR
ncbi:MAG: hypothetical protein V4858_07020 [Pseudomonadota bacterium]